MPAPPLTLSPLFAPNEAPLLGHTTPRIWTPPLRELTRETSYGYAVVDFARHVLGEPLDPWQEWVVIHAGELLPDGRPRFRHVLILVARQNGKTHLLKVLALFWLFVEQWALILGTSSNLEYAKEAWSKAVDLALEVPELAEMLPKNAVLRGNNDIHLKTIEKCKYKIAAANRRGGRSLSVDRLIQDELREQGTWAAWNAATKAMNARPYAQNFCISNQGDDTAVVLDSLRERALAYLELGVGDPRLGIFEWSAPDGSDALEPQAWCAANPNLGRRIDVDTIHGDALRAKEAGGEELSGFLTEVLCMRIRALDAAVDARAWADGTVPGNLEGLKARVAAFLDMSPDRLHATLTAAAVLPDGRVRVETVAAWSGPQATAELRRELPEWVRRVRPQAFGWIPGGPAAALAADLADRRKAGRRGWPPPGVKVEEIRAEVPALCMGLSEQVQAGQVVHNGDELLTAHITGAAKLWTGDVWRFSRKGAGHCDAAYSAAGALHLARTLPTPVGKPRILVAS